MLRLASLGSLLRDRRGKLARRAIAAAVPLAIVALASTRSSAQAPAPVPPPSASDNPLPITPPPAATPAPTTDVSTAADTDPAGDAVPDDFGRLVLDAGRHPFAQPVKGLLRVDVHGELQVRYEHDSPLLLTPPVSDRSREFLGQRDFAMTWLRLGAQGTVGETLKLVVQLDLLPRWILGDVAQGVSAAGDHARDDRVPALARLRYAYLDWTTPIGLLRVGQTGNNWGLGILANNGDRPLLFGDYRFGSIVERIAFASRPFGKQSPFVVAIAGDAVLQDATAKWTAGDRAYQAVFSAYYEKGFDHFGFFGTRRWHEVRPEYGGAKTGSINVWVADVSGKTARPVAEDIFVFGGFEIAHIRGKTDAIRSTPEFNEQDVRSWGAAAQLGLVKRAKDAPKEGAPQTYGRFVAQLEGGYASGDANPYDGTVKRFTFDPNHQIGLVLFPYMMHFMTARAATNAADEALVARPLPGSRLLVSNGGVFGATYVNPTVVFRPMSSLDLKAGAVIAVASSDVVDPYRTSTATSGGDQNYRGGSAKNRDLGLELDAGVEWRLRVQKAVTLQIGAQAGVLFPGRAFDDARGNRAKAQSVVQGRFGVQF
ncbi:MAG: hypothetical protein HYV09_34240 [Deltaproteobacteria bacterium]|nr:hypothetical protein [Deltaproteobacteria bacterium]